MRHVLDEIDARLAITRSRVAGQGAVLRPPVLALGVSERVGSNWLSDLLRAEIVQHNEPFRQQIGPAHPLSALNPSVTDITDAGLDGLARHWLVTFVVSKYATGDRHLVKETNLFFALPALLRLFPQAPVVVLTRSPVGIVSSFMRGGLWARWRYAGRYAGLAATTRRLRFSRWAPLVPGDEPDDVTALTRLVVLNAVLLAQHLADRDHTVLSYEQHVLAPQAARLRVATTLPEVLMPATVGTPEPARPGDDTFATAGTKKELVAMLSAGQADKVRAETELRLYLAADVAGSQVVRAATCPVVRTRCSPTARTKVRSRVVSRAEADSITWSGTVVDVCPRRAPRGIFFDVPVISPRSTRKVPFSASQRLHPSRPRQLGRTFSDVRATVRPTVRASGHTRQTHPPSWTLDHTGHQAPPPLQASTPPCADRRVPGKAPEGNRGYLAASETSLAGASAHGWSR